jgi:Cu(I)/Ag(I) efflux system membrane fusion protein
MKKIFQNKILHLSLMLIAGLLLGRLMFHTEASDHANHVHNEDAETIYTCSMHPQIRQNEPGKCPLCGMDLIPLSSDISNSESDPYIFTMSSEAAALANINTQKVRLITSGHEVSLSGKITVNEQRISVITANYPGRVENLYIDFTGQSIRKGDKLATIYSPELITAQKELKEAVRFKETNPALYIAAREKLRLWKIGENQIDQIESSNKIITEFDVYADQSGVVMARNIARGDYVNRGSVLFEITDLSTLWVLMDAYESDLPFIKTGQKLTFTLGSLPGQEFTSTVSFIDPFINPQTRTASVRAEVANTRNLLKPEMFVKGKVKADLPLRKRTLAIPSTALLWTGKRSLVYVKVPDTEVPSFQIREVVTGPSSGDFYIIEDGLSEGEEIVVNGVFSIDAAAQLAGKTSMLNYVNTTEISTPAAEKKVVLKNYDKAAFKRMLDSYMKLKNALVDDKFPEAQSFSGELKSNADKISESSIKSGSEDSFIKLMTQLSSNLEHSGHASNIQELRKIFQNVSNTVIQAVKLLTPLEITIYIQFCPMADENKGAYWLSMDKEVLNPYFGKKMLRCGEVKETIL